MRTLQPLLWIVTVILAVGPGAAASADSPEELCPGVDYVPHQLIVRLKPDVSINTIVGLVGADVENAMLDERTFLLELPSEFDEPFAAFLLEILELVEWVDLNTRMHTVEGATGSFFVSAVQQDFDAQYATGTINIPPPPSSGSTVRVAVIDTGVDDAHAMLTGRIASGGYNYVDDSTDTSDAGNGIDDDGDGDVDELVGHGTCIAGLIAHITPDAEILPIRVLEGDGHGDLVHAIEGIIHATDNDADVICMSFTTNINAQALHHYVQEAQDAGIVVVAPVGNAGDDGELYPAAYSGVLAVAATDENDVKIPMSNYGTHVNLSAPGESVVGPVPGGYGEADGTSLAAAWVAGAAAYLRSVDPTLECSKVWDLLTGSADDIDSINPSYAGELGAGRLNIEEAAGDL